MKTTLKVKKARGPMTFLDDFADNEGNFGAADPTTL
jgi:hypothetical protein